MFVVIFRAQIRTASEEYLLVAKRLREVALSEFGCLEFVSVCEGSAEVALSYWLDEASIVRWKRHTDHILAQELGRERWYEAYTVQVARIEREYAWPREPT